MDYLKAATRQIERLQSDRKLMEQYLTSMKARTSRKGGKLSEKTIFNYISHPAKLIQNLGPLETWTRERLEQYWANSEDYNITKTDPYKSNLRGLLRWLIDRTDDRDENLKLSRMVRTCKAGVVRRELSAADLLTPGEVELIREAASRGPTPARDRCLVSLLWESAMRPLEVISLNYEDVELGEGYAKVFVRKSKTEERTVPIVEALPDLKRWLNDHPLKERGSPLFTSFNHRNLNGRLGERSLNDILTSVMQRTDGFKTRPPVRNTRKGISHEKHKGVTAYLFRHSRITFCLNVLKMRALDVARLAGTSILMVESTYGKFIERDTIEPYLQAKGVTQAERVTPEQELVAIECPRCQITLPPNMAICVDCDYILDERLREKQEVKMADIEDLIDTAIENRMQEQERRDNMILQAIQRTSDPEKIQVLAGLLQNEAGFHKKLAEREAQATVKGEEPEPLAQVVFAVDEKAAETLITMDMAMAEGDPAKEAILEVIQEGVWSGEPTESTLGKALDKATELGVRDLRLTVTGSEEDQEDFLQWKEDVEAAMRKKEVQE